MLKKNNGYRPIIFYFDYLLLYNKCFKYDLQLFFNYFNHFFWGFNICVSLFFLPSSCVGNYIINFVKGLLFHIVLLNFFPYVLKMLLVP